MQFHFDPVMAASPPPQMRGTMMRIGLGALASNHTSRASSVVLVSYHHLQDPQPGLQVPETGR